MAFFTSSDNYQPIELTKKIADSGEGTVWQTSRVGFLAKVYKQQSQERADKLLAMLSNRPLDPNASKHHISFAWPQSLLINQARETVGFLMPEIVGGRELMQIYNPRKRKQLKLEIDWRFLHVVATNIAHVVMAIHERGYVIGDIKPQNILVNNKAMVSIIDTDSFQVKDIYSGKLHYCLVGSPGFTPPELLGSDIASTEQNIEHDLFRLGVIIYYLLFGNPPFQGKWTRDGDSPQQDELIKNGWWPYAPNSPIQPGPITIPLDIVDPQIKNNFLNCFNDGYRDPSLRPTAQSWYLALLNASGQLINCNRASGHIFRMGTGECYWCQRKKSLQLDIFDLSEIVTKTKNDRELMKEFPTAVVLGGIEGAKRDLQNGSEYIRLAGLDKALKYGEDGLSLVVKALKDPAKAVKSKAYKLLRKSSESIASKALEGFYDFDIFEKLRTIKGVHISFINSIALTNDDKYIVSGSDNDSTIKIWNFNSGKWLRTLLGHTNTINSIALTNDDKYIVSGSDDRTIKIWDFETTGKCLRTLNGHTDEIRSIALTNDDKYIVSGSWDTTIKIWNFYNGECLRTFEGHTRWISSIALTNSDKYIVSGSWDKTIKIWDFETGECLRTLLGHTNTINSIALALINSDKYIVSGSWDKTIKIWDFNSGKCLRTLEGHTNWVHSIALINSDKYIVSGSWDKTIKIWDFETGECLRTLEDHKGILGFPCTIKFIALTNDGKYIVSGSDDRTIKIWGMSED